MIVKNEEAVLQRCLQSIKDVVDEIIIVDTGSTDSTVKIAKSFGAEVYFYPWDDSFSNARNYSLEKATKDWILIMDADDQFEKEDTEILLKLVNDKESTTNAYFGETLCYTGGKFNSNIIVNMNIRLIRNNKGYKFSGKIHEQIIPGASDIGVPNAMKVENIRFYHYGYIDDIVTAKKKRERNMRIIKEELKDNPDNALMLFSMGNEYYALQDYNEALKYYLKSYEHFDKNVPFNSKLILRIASCYEITKNYGEELKIIDEGLKDYPNFTDLEFMKANIFLNTNNQIYAVKSLKKCIKTGEPSIELACLAGVGSYRPYYVLSGICFNIRNFDKAAYYAKKAASINPFCIEADSLLLRIMMIKKYNIKKIKSKLESIIKPESNKNLYYVLSDIFYDQNIFDTAFEYADSAGSFEKDKSKSNFYKGICMFYEGNFNIAYSYFKNIKSGDFFEKAACFSVLCSLFGKKIRTRKYNLLKNPYYIVTNKFKELLKGKKCTLLAENKNDSSKFIEPIFGLLSLLLKIKRFDEFEKALQLLNLIDDNSVLLRLAKLYYNYGYYKLANKEFMRSIKLNNLIDAEALEMMKKTICFS